MDLHLKIVESGDDGGCYWFLVRLTNVGGNFTYDTDEFRWAKQTHGGREINRFDYLKLARVAARHFLRRQGVELPETLEDGSPWQLGAPVRQGAQPVTTQPLTERLTRMLGAQLRVDAPEIEVALKQIPTGPGTVVTISTDFDGDVDSSNTATNGGTTLRYDDTSDYFMYMRFPLAALPAGAEVSQTDLVVEVTDDIASTSRADFQGYNQNGQADPNSDSGTVKRTRCSNDSSPYVDGRLSFQSIASETITLGSAANTDLTNAKLAVNRFSVGVSISTNVGSGNVGAAVEALEHASANEPTLSITYTRTIDVRQIHIIPYRPAPDPGLNPELALSLAGALPKIIVGTWRGEDILWHDVWTLDSANIEKLVIGRTTAANSPGPRTLYAIAANGIYYMPIGIDAHPAVAPWPLTNGVPHAQWPSGNDFELPNHVKSVERLTVLGEHLMGSEGDELTVYTHWDGADRWDKHGPYSSFPVTIDNIPGQGNVLYTLWQIKDNARSALAPYVSDVKIAIGDWTDHGPIERIQSETKAPQSM